MKNKNDPFPNGLLFEEHPGETNSETIIEIWSKDERGRKDDLVISFSRYDGEQIIDAINDMMATHPLAFGDSPLTTNAMSALEWLKEYQNNN